MDNIPSIVNSNKKLIIIPLLICIIIVCIIIVILVFSFLSSSSKNNKEVTLVTAPTPTLIPNIYSDKSNYPQDIERYVQQKSKYTGELFTSKVAKTQEERIKAMIPLNATDFSIDYSDKIKKLVITKKNENAVTSLDAWAAEQNITDIIQNETLTVVTDKSLYDYEELAAQGNASSAYSPEAQIQNFANLFSSLFSLSNTDETNAGTNTTSLSPSSSPVTTQTPNPSSSAASQMSSTPNSSYTYFAQCGGDYDSVELPNSCTICEAGCGPVTMSMILSSYIDKTLTPVKVIDFYKKNNSYLGCGGSYMSDAKKIMEEQGLKTTDYIFAGENKTAKEVASELRNYIKGGWTIFALTRFCDNGCGHFFWITDVSEDGNIHAYDPFYGKNQNPPINENERYPFPKYRYAFGVKK